MAKRTSKKLGNVYGQFVLIDTYRKNNDTVWVVKCTKCGEVQTKSRHSVEKQITECIKCGNPVIQRNVQGHYKDRIYHIFNLMIQRTTNPLKDGYKYYGGRGISVCEEWKADFMKFYNWSMENGYDETKSIDRIDTNGDYCPENCRWVSMQIQQNNRRNNKRYTINGETKTVADWARVYNISRYIVYNRLRAGWGIETALTKEIDCSKHTKKWERLHNGIKD